MNADEIEKAAEALFNAEVRGEQIPILSIAHPDMSMDDAYAVQARLVERKRQAGRSVIGWKIGLTSKAMQYALNIDTPDSGILFDDMAFASGATVPRGRFIEPRVEAEIAFVGPVNPYASAEVYVGVHDGTEFEIEEAKLLLDRYLPGGFGLVVGRFLQDFGQLNVTHAHTYPFVERPLMHREFFGEDGIVDAGVRLDWLAPPGPVTVRATAGAVSAVMPPSTSMRISRGPIMPWIAAILSTAAGMKWR